MEGRWSLGLPLNLIEPVTGAPAGGLHHSFPSCPLEIQVFYVGDQLAACIKEADLTGKGFLVTQIALLEDRVVPELCSWCPVQAETFDTNKQIGNFQLSRQRRSYQMETGVQ